MDAKRESQIKEYGRSAVPCDPKLWGGDKKFHQAPVPQLCADIPLPNTPLVNAVMKYAKKESPVHTFNHSMRVFYYGKSPYSTSHQNRLT
jgi:cyanamide hydratase